MARIQLRQAVQTSHFDCLWDTWCVLPFVQFKVYLARGQCVPSHGSALFLWGTLCAFHLVRCFSDQSQKYFDVEKSRQPPNPKDTLKRWHSSRIPFRFTSWPAFSKISFSFGKELLDIGLLLFQHDNQTVQMVSLVVPRLTAKRSLIMKNPRG